MQSHRLLSLAAAGAAAILGLSFTVPSQAQPYDDDTSTVGSVIVTAPHHERSASGAEIDRVYASRVVDISDLDLSTGWGVHLLRARVEHAAADACNELDNLWSRGLYPVEGNNADCRRRAIDRAMADAPIGQAADTDYQGY